MSEEKKDRKFAQLAPIPIEEVKTSVPKPQTQPTVYQHFDITADELQELKEIEDELKMLDPDTAANILLEWNRLKRMLKQIEYLLSRAQNEKLRSELLREKQLIEDRLRALKLELKRRAERVRELEERIKERRRKAITA